MEQRILNKEKCKKKNQHSTKLNREAVYGIGAFVIYAGSMKYGLIKDGKNKIREAMDKHFGKNSKFEKLDKKQFNILEKEFEKDEYELSCVMKLLAIGKK